ncbi:MAG: hypothetical protein QOG65_428 [Actinomycetota bacterium]|nr:hypothetical protein [Actinomycetota bacterium]
MLTDLGELERVGPARFALGLLDLDVTFDERCTTAGCDNDPRPPRTPRPRPNGPSRFPPSRITKTSRTPIAPRTDALDAGADRAEEPFGEILSRRTARPFGDTDST